MAKYRVGLIGVGGIAPVHVKMLSDLSDRGEIIGMFDIDPAQLEKRRREWGFRGFASLEALLAERPDIAWVLTPAWPRVEILEQCFAAGCHCFVEKPLALTVEGAERSADMARKAGRRLFVGHNARNEPLTRTMADWFFEGRLGDLVKVYYHEYIQRDDEVWRRKYEEGDSWRLSFEKSGGRIFEFSIHGINFLQWIGGNARWVYGWRDAVSPTIAKAGQEDLVSAHVAFAKGYGTNETIMAPGMRNRREVGIVGTRGECWGENKKIRLVIPGDQRDEIVEPRPCANRASSFLDSLDRDEAPINDGPSAIATTRICCAFNESARTHAVVELR